MNIYFIDHYSNSNSKMRPGTPTLNGCSLTLFSCQVNLPLQNSSSNSNGMESGQKKSKKSVRQINFHREKFSLKKNIGSGQKRVVKEKDEKSLSSSQSSISKNINTSQLSVQGKEKTLIATYPINIYTDNIEKGTRINCQSSEQEMESNKKKREQYRKDYNNNPYNAQFLSPSVNDTTINEQYKYRQSKDRETANTRANTNYFSQRRVITEENKETCDTFHQINLKNYRQSRPSKPNEVYRSEFLRQHKYSESPSPTIYNSAMMATKDNEINELNIQRSPALKKSSYINTQAQTQNKTKASRQIAQQQSLKIEQQPINFVKLIEDSNNFYTNIEVKAPFQSFPKKFKTLVDLNCKNVDSSGGQKTSSNHISILASLDSFKNNHIQSNGEFARVIKMMTLKNMPLSKDQTSSKFQNIQ